MQVNWLSRCVWNTFCDLRSFKVIFLKYYKLEATKEFFLELFILLLCGMWVKSNVVLYSKLSRNLKINTSKVTNTKAYYSSFLLSLPKSCYLPTSKDSFDTNQMLHKGVFTLHPLVPPQESRKRNFSRPYRFLK